MPKLGSLEKRCGRWDICDPKIVVEVQHPFIGMKPPIPIQEDTHRDEAPTPIHEDKGQKDGKSKHSDFHQKNCLHFNCTRAQPPFLYSGWRNVVRDEI